MEKATIYDFARMCKFYKNCNDCALAKSTAICQVFIEEHPDKANEIILKWCKEHPIETRQSKFLEIFPNVALVGEAINICPREIDNKYSADCTKSSCYDCKNFYWLAEIDENEWGGAANE